MELVTFVNDSDVIVVSNEDTHLPNCDLLQVLTDTHPKVQSAAQTALQQVCYFIHHFHNK